MNPALLLLVALGAAQSNGEHFLGLNVLAPVTAINHKVVKIAVPVFSNMEFGLALSGGSVLKERHMLQGRLALGSPHGFDYSFMPQLHLGYGFFLLSRPEDRSRGPYVGANLRWWDLYYRTSSLHYFNLMPAVALGHWWDRGPLYFDLRLNMVFAACSWSTQEHTSGACALGVSPAPDMAPVLPLFSLDVGHSW